MTDLPIIKTLKNGFRIVYVPYEEVGSVSFRLFGRAGAIWETQNELGAAHYVEHLVFDGTEKYPSVDKLTRLIADVGGDLNAGTGFNFVVYKVRVLKEDIEKGFDILSQMAVHPLLREKDIKKQKGIISQELTNALDDPVANFFIKSRKHLYPKGHRLSTPILGTYDSVNGLSKAKLVNYFKKSYTAKNFVLGICGNLDETKVLDLTKKYFGGMKPGRKHEFVSLRKSNNSVIYTENNKKIQQATVSILYSAPKNYTKDSYSTKYMERVLGHGFVSRLFMEIREKRGLAYKIGSSYYGEPKYGIFNIFAQVEPKKVRKVLSLINNEVTKLSNKGVTSTEYNRVKKKIAANFVFGNENPAKRAATQGKLILDDQIKENYYTQLEKFNSVTKEEVNQVAKEIFSQNPKIRVLSNKITKEQVLNAWKS